MKKFILLVFLAAIIQTGFSQSGCIPPTNLYATVFEQDVTLTWNTPTSSNNFMVMSNEMRLNHNPLIDASPQYKEIINPNSLRDFMDIQFMFPCADASGEAGVESDGSYIYSAMWNSNYFLKYDFDGTVVDSFSIASVSSVRDMAYCETDGYMYGANPQGNRIYKMDFDNYTLIEIMNISASIRAIAYDDDLDVFYGNNWGTDISVIERTTGNIINTIALPGTYASYYGFAYDNWSTGGPFVWGFTQDSPGALLVQFNLPDFTETGVVIDAIAITGGTGIAGGLFTQPNIVDGTVTLGGLLQNDIIFGLELGDAQPPMPLTLSGYNLYRDGLLVNTSTITDTTYVDANLDPGEYQYKVTALYEDTLGVFYCESDSAGPVSAIIDPFLLGGNVFVINEKLDIGFAYMYEMEGDDFVNIDATFFDTLGYYSFYPVAAAEYIVKAEPTPNSTYFTTFLPTYYGDVLHWEDATRIIATGYIYDADIHLLPVSLDNTGNGTVSGNIYYAEAGRDLDPANNIQLVLTKVSGMNSGLTYSNSNGYFEFEKLPEGTYQLYAEIMGKKVEKLDIVIQENQTTISGIVLIITDDAVVLSVGDDLPAIFESVGNVFPNPVNNVANIFIETVEPADLNIIVVNYLGQTILSDKVSVTQGKQLINLDTSKLRAGYYQLLISGDSNSVVTRKIVKL